MKVLVSTAIGLCFAVASPAVAQSQASRFQTFLDQCHSAHVCNGVYLVARGDQVLFSGAVGDAGGEARSPLTIDTAFDIGSISKQFTAMAVLRLVSEHRISLDDRVSTYLAEFPYPDVTVAQLLSHTSGIPDILNEYGARLRSSGGLTLTGADIVQVLAEARHPAVAAPGDAYQYNNTGYLVLADLVEKTSGKPFEVYLDQTFFQPLHMRNTWLRQPHERREAMPRAEGFRPRADGSRQPFDQIPGLYLRGAGGLYSTVGDLMIWETALNGGRVVPAEFLAAATAPAPLNDGSHAPYGFGLSLKPGSDGARRISHGGHWRAFKSDLSYFPQDRITIIQLTNNAEDESVDANVTSLRALAQGRDAPPTRALIVYDLQARLDESPAVIRQWFEMALHERPERYEFRESELNALGYALLNRQEAEKAELVFELGTLAFPTSSNMFDSLADAREAQGDLQGTLAAAQAAWKNDPNSQALETRVLMLLRRLSH